MPVLLYAELFVASGVGESGVLFQYAGEFNAGAGADAAAAGDGLFQHGVRAVYGTSEGAGDVV